MPATSPLPSLSELLSTHAGAVRGLGDPLADTRRGAVYDHFAGAGALLYLREARRDRDLFRALYFDTSSGARLAEIAERRFDVEPIVAAYGTGTASLARTDVSLGAGTVFAGTRISVLQAGAPLASYAVLDDVPVAADETAFDVPVRATVLGTGQAAKAVSGQETLLRIDDPLWDPGLVVVSLSCADGTEAESPTNLRARARQTALDARRGYAKALTDACIAAGASYVALFASSALGDLFDHGLSYAYVGDAGATGTDVLVRTCALALESARVLGADLQVRPMAPVALSVRATVTLWDDPGAFNLADLTDAATSAMMSAFASRTTAYGYDLDALAGACLAASDSISAVDFTLPTSSVSVATITGTTAQYPATLSRYTLAASDIVLSFQGPS